MTEQKLAEIEQILYNEGVDGLAIYEVRDLVNEVRRLQAELAVAEKGFAGAVKDLGVAVAYTAACS